MRSPRVGPGEAAQVIAASVPVGNGLREFANFEAHTFSESDFMIGSRAITITRVLCKFAGIGYAKFLPGSPVPWFFYAEIFVSLGGCIFEIVALESISHPTVRCSEQATLEVYAKQCVTRINN